MTFAYNFYCLSRKPTGKSFLIRNAVSTNNMAWITASEVQSFSWRKALEVEGKEFWGGWHITKITPLNTIKQTCNVCKLLVQICFLIFRKEIIIFLIQLHCCGTCSIKKILTTIICYDYYTIYVASFHL